MRLFSYAVSAAGLFILIAACQTSARNAPAEMSAETTSAVDLDPALQDTATFAGGCFWCMEPPFDELEGVAATISGFAGGEQPNPTYQEVANGRTQYTEAVQVIYDSTTINYERLLDVYWRNVDPLDAEGQFCDRGQQYRPEIFYHNAEQRRLAEASRQELVESDRFSEPIVVDILPVAGSFYPAEEYHQNFYKKNPQRYYSYREGCGRDARLRELWGEA